MKTMLKLLRPVGLITLLADIGFAIASLVRRTILRAPAKLPNFSRVN